MPYNLEASIKAKTEAEHEHVTPYIYKNPDIFKIITIPYYIKVKSNYRLTVDTPEDFKLANMLYSVLYEGIPIANADVYDYLEAHPELLSINSDIEQKQL